MSSVLEEAIKHREKMRADQQGKEQRKRDIDAAFEELRERRVAVSFPDYDGPDSHLRIKEDREALEAYIEHLDSGDDVRLFSREDKRTSTEEQLSGIRDALDSE